MLLRCSCLHFGMMVRFSDVARSANTCLAGCTYSICMILSVSAKFHNIECNRCKKHCTKISLFRVIVQLHPLIKPLKNEIASVRKPDRKASTVVLYFSHHICCCD